MIVISPMASDPELADAVRHLFADMEDVEWMPGLPENNDLSVV